jgi:tetratricopeptide (TPR) repeat protein
LIALGLFGAAGYLGGRELWARQHWQAAQESYKRRDFQKTQEHLVACLQVWPNDPETQLLAARTFRREGDLISAEDHLRHCEDLHVAPQTLVLERALALAQQGRLEKVEPFLLERLAQNHPDSTLILEAMSQGFIKTRRIPNVWFCTEQLLRREPDHVQGLIWHGWVLEQLNRQEEALKDYLRAVELDGENNWARLNLAEVLLNLNRADEALEQFQSLRDRLPENAAVSLGLARCFRGVGRTEEAFRLLEALHEQLHGEPGVLSELGQVALEQGQKGAAERSLKLALSKKPSDRKAAYALYLCLEQQGRHTEADRYHERVDEIDGAQKRLTEILQEMTNIRGKAPALRCEAGLLYLKLGMYEDGEQWLLNALVENPKLHKAHQALADYYERVGAKERALWHRKRAGFDSMENK